MPAIPLAAQYVPPAFTDADFRFLVRIAAQGPDFVEDWTGDHLSATFLHEGSPACEVKATTDNGLILPPQAGDPLALFFPASVMGQFQPGAYECEVLRTQPNGRVTAELVFPFVVQKGLSTYAVGEAFSGDLSGGYGGGVLIVRTSLGAAVRVLDDADVEDAFAGRIPNSEGQPPPELTLATLTLSPTTATAGSIYTGAIGGRSPGSTLSATSSDGTVLSVSGATVSGTFATAGVRTVTLTEVLTGATNSPQAAAMNITVASPSTSPGSLDFSDPANAAFAGH